MLQIKICGITCPEDAAAAVAAGADAIGLVFFPGSKRAVDWPQAQAICAAVPPFTTLVGLFVDAEERAVKTVLEQVPLNLLQFHGSESPEQCAGFGRPWIKALPVTDTSAAGMEALAQQLSRYAAARGILLDSATEGAFGGTGHTFDWSALPAELARGIVLAGGLTPDNVAEAIRRVRPVAVDVSSGVESAPGIKDAATMERFVATARRAAQELNQ